MLNVLMTTVGWLLPDETAAALAAGAPIDIEEPSFGIEWRVILLAVCLSLISYGYGARVSSPLDTFGQRR